MRPRAVLVASLLVLNTLGAACRSASNESATGADKFNQRERQLLDKLEAVQQREREIQTKLDDVRRRKQAYLNRVATRKPSAPDTTPPLERSE